ncbi:uncharacterized protein LOC116170170 [Photinus pyralis]|uniref:uncharacterized protein LOC116170170 n=1 Tax=Photinus pyralis TaxID=7054 RepID=UPI0012675B95|nr:uncharacterized protein LOC116170170 [Photinus pyralis]
MLVCGGISTSLEKLVDQVACMQSDITEIRELLRSERTVGNNLAQPNIKLPDLPAKTLEEFLLLEEYSKIPQQANALIKHLSTVGGINVGNATRRIWSLIVTDFVSSRLSWIGANEKTKLQNLNINRIIIVAVRTIIPNATDIEVLSATKVWIRKSAERIRKMDKTI